MGLAKASVPVGAVLGFAQLLFVVNIDQTLRGKGIAVATARRRTWTDTAAEGALVLAILFLLAVSGLVGYAIGRGTDNGGGGGTAVATQPETTGEGTTAGAETTTGETTTGETTTGETTETGAGGDTAEGRSVFASAGCGSCHTLEAANSSGTIGPNLDETQPSLDRALQIVRSGGNGMPAFEGQLSDDEIEAVAGFVSAAAGG